MKTLIIGKRARNWLREQSADSPQFLATPGPGRQLDDIGPPPGAKLDRFKEVDTSATRMDTLEYVGN